MAFWNCNLKADTFILGMCTWISAILSGIAKTTIRSFVKKPSGIIKLLLLAWLTSTNLYGGVTQILKQG